jgi:hypothetical protein
MFFYHLNTLIKQTKLGDILYKYIRLLALRRFKAKSLFVF